MRERRRGQKDGGHFLVLNRSCADLYEKIAEAFADRQYITVTMDRRQGPDGMTEIPAKPRRRARTRKGPAKPRLAAVRMRKEAW
jgi:hypothetical protein